MNLLLHQKGSMQLKSHYIFQNFYKRNLRTSSYASYKATRQGQQKAEASAPSQSLDMRHRRLFGEPSLMISSGSSPRNYVYYQYHFAGHGYRHIHASRTLFESPSKIDATVKKLKNQQKEKVEEIMKEVANGQVADKVNNTAASVSSAHVGKATLETSAGSSAKGEGTSTGSELTETSSKALVKPKKPLQQRIWDEIVHYYHGFRLLFIDTAISSKLLWSVLNGKTLTRRENKQLQRTTSDLFRLIPFSVFIIVPFMELLLPVFIKFFPGMLPSTFQTAKDRQERLRQSLAVRLEVAKFLQKTLGQMPVQHVEHSSEEAKQFEAFVHKIRDPNETVSNDEIIKFAKRFDDEITLDSLSREQLAALCRVLELNTIGTTMLLRFQLRLKLRSLATDDRVISREGVDSLDLFELQQACKSRGMRAYGLTAERLRFQLKEWIDLSLNEQVPPTLLLLSRAMFISNDSITTDKLKETMRVLPDAVAAHTRHAIGEREGKVDNKTKIEIIKEEERKIREEREEEREEKIASRTVNKEELAAPYVFIEEAAKVPHLMEKELEVKSDEKTISPTDVQLLSDALNTLSSDKQLVVEKETIKELKEELRDYQEDVEELREVRQVVKEPVRESRAAKLLYNRVNKMISQLDTVLGDLEQRQQQIKQVDSTDEVADSENVNQMVHIDELVATIRRMREASDGERFKVVEDLLVKLDADKDGAVSVNEITKVVQSIDSTAIDKKQLEEFTELLTKQATKSRHEELVHIDDLMLNIKKLKETSDEARLKHIESVLDKFDADKDGVVTVNEIRKVLESIGRDNIKLGEKAIEELITLLDKEQILEAEQKIEKAIAKSMKEAEKLKTDLEKTDKDMAKLVDGIHDSAKEIRDIATDLGALDRERAAQQKLEDEMKDSAKLLKDNAKELPDLLAKGPKDSKKGPGSPPSSPENTDGGSSSKSNTKGNTNSNSSSASDADTDKSTKAALLEATERHIEKLLPQNDIGLPPTIPTPSTAAQPKATAAANGTTGASAAPKKLI
ncbi:mitochondrial proton/calcium exchanger protein [Drosophila grimshawi]|uniref:Mitochondrial proton/calcium exchanger protein n=1 Tax=Drosophila grimshawi TaxID=7222 RepID=B4J538_DROGR|nr:mitochondrial proton/calcium exchanger protein [Drosophila grimshawi]XP_032591468.1 mitochondrial proton/calcium exchanger protein [Drosophila grimshawi]EDW00664.1 GH20889 [Drosophila grimshawi]